MKQIRMGVFETNSSSTHSLVVCTKEEHEKWLKGEFLYVDNTYGISEEDKPNGDFVSKEVATALIKKGAKDYDFLTYEGWNEDYEEEIYDHTTKLGEELVIRCYYGYDG